MVSSWVPKHTNGRPISSGSSNASSSGGSARPLSRERVVGGWYKPSKDGGSAGSAQAALVAAQLHDAAGKGDTAALRQHLRHPAADEAFYIDKYYDALERTPLHIAAAKNHPAACAELLAGGADLFAVDLLGMTPLTY